MHDDDDIPTRDRETETAIDKADAHEDGLADQQSLHREETHVTVGDIVDTGIGWTDRAGPCPITEWSTRVQSLSDYNGCV